MNGVITLGSLDGTNLEIQKVVGEENIFMFQNTTTSLSTRALNALQFIESKFGFEVKHIDSVNEYLDCLDSAKAMYFGNK